MPYKEKGDPALDSVAGHGGLAKQPLKGGPVEDTDDTTAEGRSASSEAIAERREREEEIEKTVRPVEEQPPPRPEELTGVLSRTMRGS